MMIRTLPDIGVLTHSYSSVVATARGSLPSPSTANTRNLTLGEPALATRMFFIDSGSGQWRIDPARMCVQHCYPAGRHARAHGICPGSENDRHACAEHDAGRIRIGKEYQILGEHVARFEIGHDENLRLPSDCRFDAFDLGRLGA